jgi:hypothetical protein
MDMTGNGKSFDASKSEARQTQANRLNDRALEDVAGGAAYIVMYCENCNVMVHEGNEDDHYNHKIVWKKMF